MDVVLGFAAQDRKSLEQHYRPAKKLIWSMFSLDTERQPLTLLLPVDLFLLILKSAQPRSVSVLCFLVGLECEGEVTGCNEPVTDGALLRCRQQDLWWGQDAAIKSQEMYCASFFGHIFLTLVSLSFCFLIFMQFCTISVCFCFSPSVVHIYACLIISALLLPLLALTPFLSHFSFFFFVTHLLLP